ncbi:hypothetical protein R1sor_015577 [Riccia sorocarpa]|uniref:Ubiquitin-like protease family profile domain-containing protein n=1 Tax=Riccia sorocarpa TaxID=122646 RepID=A0ABD3HCL8_9MARC
MPEIDDVRIAPPRGDTKGKSIANEEEEQNPNPSASKDTSAAPSGSGKSTRGYGDLPTKFHEFTSQRSQGLPDIISNPESVNKIMYATRLLCDVVEEHVVDNETNYSQFSQPVDLASSSQIEREKYERLKLNMRTTIVATGIHLQKNSFDCGVHVLYIITKLIEAEKEGKLLQYLENGGVPTKWGTPEIVSNFRQELRDWFDQLSE